MRIQVSIQPAVEDVKMSNKDYREVTIIVFLLIVLLALSFIYEWFAEPGPTSTDVLSMIRAPVPPPFGTGFCLYERSSLFCPPNKPGTADHQVFNPWRNV